LIKVHELVIFVIFRRFKNVDRGNGESAKSSLAALEQLALSESRGDTHITFTISIKVRVIFPAKSKQSIRAGTTGKKGQVGLDTVQRLRCTNSKQSTATYGLLLLFVHLGKASVRSNPKPRHAPDI
jgi:hypothetical protein